jgi:hypothetical protein
MHDETHNKHDALNYRCQQAECRPIEGDLIEYGRPDLNVCASVERDTRNGWSYLVSCRLTRYHVQGLYPDRARAIQEMLLWLRRVGCPGHLPEELLGERCPPGQRWRGGSLLALIDDHPCEQLPVVNRNHGLGLRDDLGTTVT